VLGASCAACGELLERPTRGPVCGRCWQSLHAAVPCVFGVSDAVADAQAIGLYEGPLRSIVHALKYEGRRSLATPLAALMRERCPIVLDGADVIVPVPLHPSRRRERGFNQALDLAKGLGLPVVPAIRRIRATAPQVELGAEARRRNVRHAFAPSRLPWRANAVGDRIAVVVDDVSTTGITLDECARVLRALGAREVRAITAARAVLSAPMD
jgi:ComF family protein